MKPHEQNHHDDEEPADATLRRVLSETGGLAPLMQPPHLALHAARRLPQTLPSQALQRERRAHTRHLVVRAGVILAAILMLVSTPAALTQARQAARAYSGGSTNLMMVMTPRTDLLNLADPLDRAALGGLVALVMLTFAALTLVRWPGRTAVGGLALSRRPAAAVLAGLVPALLCAALIPSSALLAQSFVGMPLAALLLAPAIAALTCGLAMTTRALGARVSGLAAPPVTPDRPTVAVALVLTLVVGLVAALAWPWWVLVFAALAAPGLGAALMTRLGTKVRG
jgi:hypothetical protein